MTCSAQVGKIIFHKNYVGKNFKKKNVWETSQDLWIITEQAVMNWIKSVWAGFILFGLRGA